MTGYTEKNIYKIGAPGSAGYHIAISTNGTSMQASLIGDRIDERIDERIEKELNND